MMKKTHTAIAIATAIPVINYFHLPFISIVGIAGAVAPDWDFILGIKHRTITHSLILLIASSFLISIFNVDIGLVWFVSYFLHLIADSFTKMGVPFLYPFVKRRYGFKLIRTGGAEDMFICIVAIFLISQQLL